MTDVLSEDLGQGVVRIDAAYIRPGLACFYLVEGRGEVAVLETGTVHSVPALERVLAQRGITHRQVRYVIPTHVHLDHAGGAGLMMRRFPQAQLLAHPRGACHLVDPARLIDGTRAVYGERRYRALYGEILPVNAERVLEVADGERVSCGGRSLLIRHTPGHADHHVCVWDEASRGWFSGDVFGICYSRFRSPGGDYVMPSTTPTQFRPEALLDSLRLLARQQPEYIYLTHYGRLSYSEGKLQRLISQLRQYVELGRSLAGDVGALERAIVELSLAQLAGMNPTASVDALREWVNHDAGLNAQGLAAWYRRQAS